MTLTTNSGSDDLRGRVTRSLGWVVLERWGSRLLQLGVFTILARLVAPDVFGIVAAASAVIAVLQVIVDSGFSAALVQMSELEAKDISTAFWTSVISSVVVYLAVLAFAPLLAAVLGEPQLTSILRVLALVLPIGALSQTPAAILERSLNFRVLSVRQLAAAVIGATAGILLALFGFGVWALVGQTITTAVVASIVLWATTSWRPRLEYSWKSFSRIWPIGLGIMGTQLLDAVQANVDKLVVGVFFSAEILGYYFIAQRMGTILTELVTSVIIRVSLSTFSRVQHDLPRLNRIFRQMTFVSGLVGVPIFGLCALLGPQLVPALFGSRWTPSIPIFWGLAAGMGLGAIMYFDRPVLLARRQTVAAFWLTAAQNILSVLLVFLLLPLGIVGVVVSRWARVFLWPLRLWIMRRAINLQVCQYLLQVLRVIVAFLPIGGIVISLQCTPWARSQWNLVTFAMPVGLASLVVYAIIAWGLAGQENRDAVRRALNPLFRAARRRG